MRKTDCERARDLMPLRATTDAEAAGDLEKRRADELAAHVSTCVDCRRLAREFTESRALLADACDVPEFGEAFYAQIRGTVLDEIKRARRRRTPTSPTPFIASLFRYRWAYAASLALLLLACGLTLRHYRRDAGAGAQQIANGSQREVGITPTSRVTFGATPIRAPQTTGPSGVSGALSIGRGSHELPTHRRAAPAPKRPAARRLEQRMQVEPTQLTEVARAPVSVETATSAAAPASEVSRIEIQTADPNIRIIWLAPPKAAAPDPHDDHERENGESK